MTGKKLDGQADETKQELRITGLSGNGERGGRGGRRRGLKEKGKGNRQIDNGQGWGPGGLFGLL